MHPVSNFYLSLYYDTESANEIKKDEPRREKKNKRVFIVAENIQHRRFLLLSFHNIIHVNITRKKKMSTTDCRTD